ncbi:uncharacterized protein DNG_00827 [Cephalotrichum gorgonifer]|uniref:Uncharacterized protein n=1 Tax=Cephalotrichum gorgonifer TaxID=2041049 RepID=A0AAE8MRQ3_9PEZI|nr:uncharacterized protein DNG_00827 [Cephalotrichum gorgonifer]
MAQKKQEGSETPADGPLAAGEARPSSECTSLQSRSAALHPPEVSGWVLYASDGRSASFKALMQRAYEDYVLGGPRLTNLNALIRINVLNAMANNATRMGFTSPGLCDDDHISPYSLLGPPPPQQPTLPSPSCPECLLPTAVQKRLSHHPWIDLLPFPRFRDNTILGIEAGLLDEDELCMDISELPDTVKDRNPTLIVWGEPWNCRAWEVTPDFLRKWGWLLRGCPEILEATNYWRMTRGEKKLIFDPRF